MQSYSSTSMPDGILETDDDLSFDFPKPFAARHDGSIPSKSTLYRTHLSHALKLPSSTDVMDLTSYIDRGPLIATGGFGQVYKGKWKNVGYLHPDDWQKLPQVAVKVINPLTLDDDKQSKASRAFDNGLYKFR